MRGYKNESVMTENQQSGVVLVIVICFTAIVAVLSAGLLTESMTKVKIARRQVNMEQAFYVAEGGAERSVSYIQAAGTIPGTITGTIGNGNYITTILDADEIASTGGAHTAAGDININPNNSPDNEFMLVASDGTFLTRDDLHQDQSDRDGTAYVIRLKPKGSGSQNGLTVDGATYTLANNNTYTFFSSAGMDYSLVNDNRNPQGKAVGKWWININGSSVSINDNSTAGSGASQNYTILSIGTVSGVKRIVVLEGLHQQSWAQYALMYDRAAGPIWIVGSETFLGSVHANTTLYLRDTPVFWALLSTTASGWGSGSSIGGVTFMEGWEFNSPTQTMASVDFTNLLASASLVVTGSTDITLSNSNVLITNPNNGWTNNVVSATGLIYVATSGSDQGTVSIGGTLDGRLTVAVDRDIRITNHVTYAVHPTNDSDDALGLIAQNNVIVMTNAPANLNIFAHIISAGTNVSYWSGFYVQDFLNRPFSGDLNVYGGIAEYIRGAVGLVGQTAGFEKNYVYDTRFATDPPPHYPVITNNYLWRGWRDKM